MSLKLITEAHRRRSVSSDDKRKIRENYPQATDALIAERAIDIEGTLLMVAIANDLSRIAVDYNPETYTGGEMVSTDALLLVSERMEQIWDDALETGMSELSIACTTVVAAMAFAKQWVPSIMMIRPLLDCIDMALGGDNRTAAYEADMDEKVIDGIMTQMGVSRAAAEQYLERAKRSLPAEPIEGKGKPH